MAVNLSVAQMRTKVGRPSRLSEEDQQLFFPQLTREGDYEYYLVKKPLGAGEEGMEHHCLRTTFGASPSVVNKMAWYCHTCSSFPCTWRARLKHKKKCVASQQAMLDDLMEEFMGMELSSQLGGSLGPVDPRQPTPMDLSVQGMQELPRAPSDPFSVALEATLADLDALSFSKPQASL